MWDERVSDEDLIGELIYRLCDRDRVLLVLDQLEAIADSPDRDTFTDFLSRWQQQGRRSTLLAIARHSLLPEAETNEETNPDPPEEAAIPRLNLGGLSPSEGTTLLRRQHHLTAARDDSLSRLVELAAGHPLLLNLAANWLKQTHNPTVDDTALDFFQRLFYQYEGKPEAQVGKIFTILFEALPERWQTLLLGVSVYRDPFTLAAAQAMLPDASEADLDRLTERAFLQSQTNCWSLHPLMLQSVHQRLQQQGQATAAHEQAIAYFQAHLKPSGSSIADVAEYLAIFHHRCELQQYDLAYQMIDGCYEFLELSGYYRELVQIYERLTRSWQQQAPAAPEEQGNLGWSWTRLGTIYRALGQFHTAIAAHQQAQPWFEQIKHDHGKAACLVNLGAVYSNLGQDEQAIEFHQQSLAIFREIGHRRGEAASLGNLGFASGKLRQYQQAINFSQQSLAIEREIGNRQGEANALNNLGLSYSHLGQYERASEFYQQSIAIKCEIGDRLGEAKSLFNLALALARDNLRQLEALARLKQVRAIYVNLGLNHKVEKCDQYIHYFNEIVATKELFAPQMAPTIGAPPPVDEKWQRSMPTASSAGAGSPSSGELSGWVRWLSLFGGGVVIVIVAHALLSR